MKFTDGPVFPLVELVRFDSSTKLYRILGYDFVFELFIPDEIIDERTRLETVGQRGPLRVSTAAWDKIIDVWTQVQQKS